MTRAGDRLVPLFYAAAALVVYAPALSAFFVADDYYFLDLIMPAPDVRVVFTPLIGRFARPLVVLLYYACYHVAGLTPWVFHSLVLLVHVLNAWLVFLIGRRLLPGDSRAGAMLAGLLFVVFSSHSEAVAWVAGAADPIAALGLLSGFLAFLRARDPGSSPAWIAVSVCAAAAAALAKESWIVFPAIVIAYALCFPAGDPGARRRTMTIAAATLVLAALYLVRRVLVFGSVTGGYAGLGTTLGSGRWPREVAKFVFRCFLPAGQWVLRFWPLAAVCVTVVVVLVVMRARGATWRPLAFTAAAVAIALAPVLPLSISIVNTESERFTYTASAFSSLLVICAAGVVFQGRVLMTLASGALIAWHGAVLSQNARRLNAAGLMVRRVVAGFVEQARAHDPDGRSVIAILNLPDNLGGTYVFRSGFDTAVRLAAPDAIDLVARTTCVATHGIRDESDSVAVQPEAAGVFALDVAPNALIQRQLQDGPSHRILSMSPTGYRAEFRDPVRRSVVLAYSAGRMVYAGSVEPAREGSSPR